MWHGMGSVLVMLAPVLLAACASAAVSRKTHVLAILADDFGWNDAGWHAESGGGEDEVARTPNMDKLVESGMELDRNYAFKFCSPTRSAIQSGRNPIHVNVQNMDPLNVNPADPVAGFSAVARNFTGLGAVMKKGGYKTYFAGKWDCGMATPDHTPMGRGYDESLIYFHHMCVPDCAASV